MNIFKFIKIDENSRVPKYQQIVDSIIFNITAGNFKTDQKIPSINMFSEEFYLSRDTVEKAYSILKEREIIISTKGKGFYIAQTKLPSKINIFFLVNKFSSYKLLIYNAFIDAIGINVNTDLYNYYCDETTFLYLMEKHKSAYDYFVIMTHFKTEDLKHISYTDSVIDTIKKIPEEKLIILDNIKLNLEGKIVEIYQDFENDIYNALLEGYSKIVKYQKLILIYKDKSVYPVPRRIMYGFRKFCVEKSINFEIISETYIDIILKRGDLFITIEESDLVSLVKQIRDQEFILGKDIGIISYNETPLKELLGITVMSTDFKIMGETAARMILNKEKGKYKVPFNFIDRNSL
ncbi:GntR family transcriptional regulator [Flavobacterium sp.]|uniref:GntR family transcriptional regulator n=1 Tax=Flavobacterium sp. TaxID=239 RepID=UPI00286EB2AD|nr:GntR family transcriptional regulator [Flavobacterium sp.]